MTISKDDYNEVTLNVFVTVEVMDNEYAGRGKVEFTDQVFWAPGLPVAEQIRAALTDLGNQIGPTLDTRVARIAGLEPPTDPA